MITWARVNRKSTRVCDSQIEITTRAHTALVTNSLPPQISAWKEGVALPECVRRGPQRQLGVGKT